MIVILDYGMGNLRSVERALHHLAADCRIQEDLKGVEKLILPGVGAFGAAMDRLGPLSDEIRAFASSGQPLLGICLGQQLLMEVGEEHGERTGLGLIAGRVRYFPSDMGLKVPHIGWNDALFRADTPMGKGLGGGEQFYYVHSLYTDCSELEDVAATCEYGIPFCAAVCRGNVWGVQFHPEKSGEAGLKLLQNFVRC